MLKDFITNGALIISSLFIIGQLFKNHPIRPSSPWEVKLVAGTLFGLLGIVLMGFSIRVTDTTIADLRHIPVILAAIYGGMPVSLWSSLLIACGRLFLFPFSIAGINSAIGMLLIGITCGLLAKRQFTPFFKFLTMNIAALLVVSLMLFINIPNTLLFLETLLNHWIISILAGLATFYTADYISRSNELFQKFKEYSTKDFLTGLNNVRQFDTLFSEYTKKAEEHNETLSLLVIDIDHFKKINDTYGHPAGDEILKEVATILSCTTRSIDIVSRNGGEEFSVILPNCSYIQAVELAEQIRLAVKQHSFILLDGSSIHITVSIGVASYPETEKERLYQYADQMLYQAKKTGRDKVC